MKLFIKSVFTIAIASLVSCGGPAEKKESTNSGVLQEVLQKKYM